MKRRNRRRQIQTESLEVRTLLAASPVRLDNTLYFPSETQPQISRFDLDTGNWLTPVTLAGTSSGISALNVQSNAIYAAFGRSVVQYQVDGSQRTVIGNVSSPVDALHVDGNVLLVNHNYGLYARVTSFNRQSGSQIDTHEQYVDSLVGSSIVPSRNRIIGRSTGISPSDITFVGYTDNGMFVSGGSSRYHGDYPGALKTWAAPRGDIVIDDAGIVYSTDDLTYAGSLGNRIQDLDFLGPDVPIALAGSTITAYTSTFLPTGSLTLPRTPAEIAVTADRLYYFTADATSAAGFRADSIPLADLSPPQPGAPVNPVGLSYKPEKIEVSSDGKLLIFDKGSRSIFRWDPATQTYGATIPLIGSASYMAYSGTTNTIYLAYASGLIRKIDLNQAVPQEVPFAAVAETPLGLSTAGEFVLCVDGSGAWVSHWIFKPDGTRTDWVDWNYVSSEYVWNPQTRRMYYFRDDTSPNDLHAEAIGTNGRITGRYESPLHESAPFQHPIRFNTDGSLVILGSGAIFDALTIERKSQSLSNSVHDIAAINGGMISIREIGNSTQVQKWNATTWTAIGNRQLTGTPVSITSLPNNTVLCILHDTRGVPQFFVLDANLDLITSANRVLIRETNAGTMVSEDGATDSITVALSSQPASNVVIRIRPDRPAEVVAEASELIFTPDNWNLPQQVVLNGVDDDSEDQDQFASVTFTIDATRSDSAWSGVATESLVVTNIDNDGDYDSLLPVMQLGDTAFIIRRSGPTIHRLDMTTGTWMSPIKPMIDAGHPTAALVEADTLYMAFGRTLYRFAPDGTGPKHILTSEFPISGLHKDEHLLLIVSDAGISGSFASLDTSSDSIIDVSTRLNPYGLTGSSIFPGLNRIIGRSSRLVSPSDVTFVSYDSEGRFNASGNSPYHGRYPYAAETWAVVDSNHVIDDAGIVYHADSLDYAGSLMNEPDDLALIDGTRPLVLSGKTITEYSEYYLPLRTASLSQDYQQIAVSSNNVFAFASDSSVDEAVRVESIDFADLQAPQPGPPIDPRGLAFTPDATALAGDGTVLMFSSVNKSIFRYDPMAKAWKPTIPLLGSPLFMAASTELNSVFTAYESGLIRRISLSDPDLKEVPFAQLTNTPTGLAMAGEFLFASDPSGAWHSHYTFDKTGHSVSSIEWTHPSREFIWNSTNRRMYFLREGMSPLDLYAETINLSGEITSQSETPLHESSPFQFPIRVSPDGSTVVLGSGRMFHGLTMKPIGQLDNRYSDMAFLDDAMIGLASGDKIFAHHYAAGQKPESSASLSVTLNAASAKLVQLSGTLVLVIVQDNSGVPSFRIVDSQLITIDPTLQVLPVSGHSVRSRSDEIRWEPVVGATEYEMMVSDSTGVKLRRTVTQPRSGALNLASDVDHQIRFRAKNASGTWTSWSTAYQFRTDYLRITGPLRASASTRQTVTWAGHTDAASFEIWINSLDEKRIFHRAAGLKGTTYAIPADFTPGRYAVWIRSADASGVVSPWTDGYAMEVLVPPVELHEALRVTNDDSPRLAWNPVARVSSYNVYVRSVDGGQLVWSRTRITATAVDLPVRLRAGQYKVWIRAVAYGREVSVWGSGSPLLITSPPTLNSSSIDSEAALNWTATTAATGYDIEVRHTRSGQIVHTVSNLQLTQTTLPELTSYGLFEIALRTAYAGGLKSRWSRTTLERFRPAVELTSTSGPTMDQTPVLTWRAVQGASHYQLSILGPDGRVAYQQDELSGTSHRVESRLSNGQSTVVVRAIFDDGSRTAVNSSHVLQVGQSPTVTKTGATLSWASIPHATNYEIWINTLDSAGRPLGSAIRTPLHPTTSFSLSSLQKGRYIAWIRAIRAEGGAIYQGLWSSAIEFTM